MRHSARHHLSLQNAFLSALVLTGVTVIGLLFDMSGLKEINIYTVYILGILVIAVLTASRGFSVLSSIVGVLLFNFLFAEPRFSIQAVNFGYPLDFVLLISVALLVSTLASSNKRLAYRTGILLQTDQLFLKASGAEEILSITMEQLTQLLDRVVVLHPAENGKIRPAKFYGGASPSEENPEAAQWAFENRALSGARTPRFSSSAFTYAPICTEDRCFGVVGVSADEHPMSEMESNLFSALLSECALTLERDYFNRKRQEADLEIRNEKLRSSLLRSISHDLRTPLTGLLGSADLLADSENQLSAAQKHQLYLDIRDDAQWLLGTVENLLSVTRIENGKLALRLQPELLGEIIPESLRHFRKDQSRIRFEQEDELLLARVDARLILQVITNLVDNALKYTPSDSEVIVRTLRRDGFAVIEVSDRGPGIPDDAKEKVFEMFYTTSKGSGDGRRGLGLGLALCKAIVESHGGTIFVTDNVPCGSVFTLTLPEERIDLA